MISIGSSFPNLHNGGFRIFNICTNKGAMWKHVEGTEFGL